MKIIIIMFLIITTNVVYCQAKPRRMISNDDAIELKNRFFSFYNCRQLFFDKKNKLEIKVARFDKCVKKYLNEKILGSENVREYSFWLLSIPSGPIDNIYKCSDTMTQELTILDDFSPAHICFSVGKKEGFVFFQDQKIARISLNIDSRLFNLIPSH